MQVNMSSCNKVVHLIILISYMAVLAQDECTSCHEDIQTSCGLSCISCHQGDGAENYDKENHPPVISNPSKAEYWFQKCAGCHEDQIQKFMNSKHYSMIGMISQTRYLWGETSQLNLNSEENDWHNLKISNGKTPAGLVDRLLVQKCFACHFNADGKNNGAGKIRSSGCAACHIPLDQNSGKPLFGHKMQKQVSDTVCLTCHNGNRAGADYYGYFEHDYHNDFQTPVGSKPYFEAYQHRLQQDLHKQAGMKCMDCHLEHDIMDEAQAVKTCESCHGGFNYKTELPDQKLKQFKTDVISHKSFHKKVSCSACHAAWTFQDYGLHLYLDETNHHGPWLDYLWQGDINVTNYLQAQDGKPEDEVEPAWSINHLTGERMPGIWYKAWTFRRWEGIILGKDENGYYQAVRPDYQYHITYVDSNDNIWLDSKIPGTADGKKGWSWDTYTPHTIGKKGRACESCHGNSLATGLGIRNNKDDKPANPITIPSEPILNNARLLTPFEQKRLLNNSRDYRYWRAKQMRSEGILKLFKMKKGTE